MTKQMFLYRYRMVSVNSKMGAFK